MGVVVFAVRCLIVRITTAETRCRHSYALAMREQRHFFHHRIYVYIQIHLSAEILRQNARSFTFYTYIINRRKHNSYIKRLITCISDSVVFPVTCDPWHCIHPSTNTINNGDHKLTTLLLTKSLSVHDIIKKQQNSS